MLGLRQDTNFGRGFATAAAFCAHRPRQVLLHAMNRALLIEALFDFKDVTARLTTVESVHERRTRARARALAAALAAVTETAPLGLLAVHDAERRLNHHIDDKLEWRDVQAIVRLSDQHEQGQEVGREVDPRYLGAHLHRVCLVSHLNLQKVFRADSDITMIRGWQPPPLCHHGPQSQGVCWRVSQRLPDVIRQALEGIQGHCGLLHF
jgi:hypothetical protein